MEVVLQACGYVVYVCGVCEDDGGDGGDENVVYGYGDYGYGEYVCGGYGHGEDGDGECGHGKWENGYGENGYGESDDEMVREGDDALDHQCNRRRGRFADGDVRRLPRGRPRHAAAV